MESMTNYYNKIHLLCQYKMMQKNWSSWTEDSFCTEMLLLDDYEIIDFINKTDDEIENIHLQVDEFYKKNIQS